MSRVLITGANGFIGSNLCGWFRGRGWEVDALVRESSDLHFLDGLDVRLIKGDLRFPEEIDLPAGTTHIIHAASLVSDLAGDEECARHIFDMTRNFVRRLRDSGVPLRRFVYISTALTLGFGRRDISEDKPGRSAAFMPYVRHKLRTENELRDEHASRGFPVVILRPGDVFGPNDRVTCANILRGCERGAPLIVGQGCWRFGYCYVGNLCQAVELALAKEGIEGRSYTVTNGNLPTWRDFFLALQKGLGRKRADLYPHLARPCRLRSIGPSRGPPPPFRARAELLPDQTHHDRNDIRHLRTVVELGYRPTTTSSASSPRSSNG